MMVMFSSFVFMVSFILIIAYNFSSKARRFSAFRDLAYRSIQRLISSKVATSFLIVAFIFIAYSNVLGNIPGNYTPTQYYRVVMRLRVSF